MAWAGEMNIERVFLFVGDEDRYFESLGFVPTYGEPLPSAFYDAALPEHGQIVSRLIRPLDNGI